MPVFGTARDVTVRCISNASSNGLRTTQSISRKRRNKGVRLSSICGPAPSATTATPKKCLFIGVSVEKRKILNTTPIPHLTHVGIYAGSCEVLLAYILAICSVIQVLALLATSSERLKLATVGKRRCKLNAANQIPVLPAVTSVRKH
jgi:hypothetical protein